MQGSELSVLSQWQNFYMMMGTAAATLTGLMFVATTLLAGLDTHNQTTLEDWSWYRALKRTHTHPEEESQEQTHGNPTHHEHRTPK